MKKQRGQSMTEYLVVLGVTGAGLLAATTDVTALLDNVQNNYRTQSSEMSKVQIYSNPKLQINPITRDDGDGDDGDEPSPPSGDIPEAEYPPTLLSVMDADGNYLGTLDQNDMLVDAQGNEIAWCKRQVNGQCTFIKDGKEVFPGAVTNSDWVDDDGKPLPLIALSRNGAVVGFVYLYNDKYYDVSTRKRLNPQPTNLSATQTRRVSSYDGDGKLFSAGYEADGLIYSDGTVLSGNTLDFSTAKKIEGELVSVQFADPTLPSNEPRKYKPCVVALNNWSTGISNGTTVPGFVANPLFTNPSSFVDAAAATCNGRNTVRLNTNGSWTKIN